MLKTNYPNGYEEERPINKFGVPHHMYVLTLADGTTKSIDVGYEEDWGLVQDCNPEDTRDWANCVGFGNDVDGHTKIVAVVDEETGKPLEVCQWAKNDVWIYVNCYSEDGCAECLSLGRARPTKLDQCRWLQSLERRCRQKSPGDGE